MPSGVYIRTKKTRGLLSKSAKILAEKRPRSLTGKFLSGSLNLPTIEANCIVCEKELSKTQKQYCSRKCFGVSCRKNKDSLYPHIGSKEKTWDGYIIEFNPFHPTAPKKGWVREHKRIMSDYLGRPLNKYETVHHKNGIRDDNRLENLELWTHPHPSGQRVEDIIKWMTRSYPAICKKYLAIESEIKEQ